MHRQVLVAMLALAGAASPLYAWEFRFRFVERIGSTDLPLAGFTVDATDNGVHNVRLQFGVFDDAQGPAPAGGFVGWNVGFADVSGTVGNSDDRRNPGRLSPFTFASGPNSNGNPPLPAGDPFELLTEIDATLGTQSPIWQCDAAGNAPPQPAATVRGRNTFVSVYAFSVDPVTGQDYTIDFGGNLIAATSWREVGTPTPPDCGDPADPSDDVPGSVTYAPFPTAPQSFNVTFVVHTTPAPGAAALFGLAALGVSRRRR